MLIYPLREVMPAISTGVIYLLVVLVISIYWGLWLGLLTSLLSATAFNFFHIPPTGYFTIADAQNWVALGVYSSNHRANRLVLHFCLSRPDLDPDHVPDVSPRLGVRFGRAGLGDFLGSRCELGD